MAPLTPRRLGRFFASRKSRQSGNAKSTEGSVLTELSSSKINRLPHNPPPSEETNTQNRYAAKKRSRSLCDSEVEALQSPKRSRTCYGDDRASPEESFTHIAQSSTTKQIKASCIRGRSGRLHYRELGALADQRAQFSTGLLCECSTKLGRQ